MIEMIDKIIVKTYFKEGDYNIRKDAGAIALTTTMEEDFKSVDKLLEEVSVSIKDTIKETYNNV